MPPPRLRLPPLFSRIRILQSAIKPYTGATHHVARAQTRLRTQLLRVVQVFLAVHLFTKYCYSLRFTEGVSMVPTIPATSKPCILLSKYYRRGRGLRVGDVIEFAHPMWPGISACKRIIGMPGDYVSVVSPGRTDNDLGKEGDEWAAVKEEMLRVPEGHCWVAGDNLEWSRDSRVFGPVPLALVNARALAVVWPPTEMKALRNGLMDRTDEAEKDWVVA